MTVEEHRAKHIHLHHCLDELIADYISQNETKFLSGTTLLDIMEWSHAQTQNPTTDMHRDKRHV